MLVVGVTGSFASGKSEVSRLLQKMGAEVFDADRSARRLVRKGMPAYQAVVKLFGRSFLGRDGQIDRARLAEFVFNRPSALKKLMTVIHPMVIMDCMKMIQARRPRSGMLVLDVPLLFESRMERLADLILVVRAKPQVLARRAEARGISRDLAKKILKSQWPIAKKARLADFVIENNGSREALERRVRELYEMISVHKGGR